jgi:hypothetical protein
MWFLASYIELGWMLKKKQYHTKTKKHWKTQQLGKYEEKKKKKGVQSHHSLSNNKCKTIFKQMTYRVE